MVHNDWLLDVREREIEISEDFKLNDLLTTEVQISQWVS